MFLWILHFFFGILGYWMMYGIAVAGNELTLAVYVLGGFITFWVVVFIKIWWIALILIALIVAGLYFGNLYYEHKRKLNAETRRRMRGF